MNEKKFFMRIKQTNASIIIEEKYFNICYNEVLRQRKYIENYLRKDPFFKITLKPYIVDESSPKIIKNMAYASKKFDVGPMASVAGAIAHYAVKATVNKGATFAVFENGGDIALFIDKPINVGIYSGPRFENISMRIYPKNKIFGICTSSGKMGSSLSFGYADSVTVIAENAIIADAAATAICNSIKIPDPILIEKSLNKFLIDDVESIIVIVDNFIGIAGNIPEFINLKIPPNLITIV